MKKIKFIIPTLILFASPWAQKLIYNNILLAWPNIDIMVAYWLALTGALIAFAATAMMSIMAKYDEGE